MNADQVKRAVIDAAGRVQQKAGEAVGSTPLQGRGLEKQIESKAQKAVGDVKVAAKKTTAIWFEQAYRAWACWLLVSRTISVANP